MSLIGNSPIFYLNLKKLTPFTFGRSEIYTDLYFIVKTTLNEGLQYLTIVYLFWGFFVPVKLLNLKIHLLKV